MKVDIKFLQDLVSDKANFGEDVVVETGITHKRGVTTHYLEIKMNKKIVFAFATAVAGGYYSREIAERDLVKMTVKHLLIKGIWKAKEMVEEDEQLKKESK